MLDLIFAGTFNLVYPGLLVHRAEHPVQSVPLLLLLAHVVAGVILVEEGSVITAIPNIASPCVRHEPCLTMFRIG